MKRCPECRRDYYDETLLYCLDDGNALLDGPATYKTTDEPATAILPRPELASEAATIEGRKVDQVPAGMRLSPGWIVGAVVLTGLLSFAVIWFLDQRDKQ